MRRNTKRSVVVAGIATVAIGGGVAAWASGWGVDGTGSGTAQASTIAKLTATSMLNKSIYPGAKVTATTKVDNPNDFSVALNTDVTATSVSLAPGAVSSAGGTAATTGSNTCVNEVNAALKASKVIIVAFPRGTVVKPGPDNTITSTVTVGDLPQSCVGVKLTVNYSFSGVSAADA